MTTYPHEATINAAGLPCRVITTDPRDLFDAVDATLSELSNLTSVTSLEDSSSEAARLSRLAAHADVTAPASDLMLDHLTAALWVADLTDGLVVPTGGSGGAVSAWEGIEVGGESVRLPRGTVLDLSATVLAHTADQFALRLHRETGNGFLVSLGDAVAVAGDAPADGWEIPVTSPRGRTLQVISTQHAAVAGSRGVEAGVPASVWSQVTVAASSALEARACAVASRRKGERAPAWLSNRGIPARLERRSGTTRFTAGWPDTVLTAA